MARQRRPRSERSRLATTGGAPETRRGRQRGRGAAIERTPRRFDDDEEMPPWGRPAVRRQRPNHEETFRCRHCHALVGPVPSGGRHRNHCPVCLHSRHVDDRTAGDRASACGGGMAPIGVFAQRNGEQSLVHRCLSCGVVRHNRIAADDDYDLVLSLPDLTRAEMDEHGTLSEG